MAAFAALATSLAIGGCGGGSDSVITTTSASGSASGENSSGLSGGTSTGGPAILPPPTPIVGSSTLRVASSIGGTSLPFAAGYVFKQGDMPAGRFVTASGSNLRGFQANVKNRWPDGSAKFAVLSGRLDLPAGGEQSLQIGWTDAGPSGEALGLADLQAAGVTAAISYGAYGSVAWSGSSWDAPFMQWISGPEMSSWIYRRPIGSDQHLVAWIEVRLYRGGAVEVLPWIENGFLLRAAPGERSGTAIFSLNNSARFAGEITLHNHTRVVLASGKTLSHWLGSDPGIAFRHDMGYLQMTGLVPAYRAVTPGNADLFSRIATSYSPLGQHNYPNEMGTAGFHWSIGPLPEWDVVYLTSDGDQRAWRSVQVNGYAAGRYGFHFRDEATHRAPRFSSYPNLVLSPTSGLFGTGASTKDQYTPDASGGYPPEFSNTHMPAIGFMAYLITGRWYFLDEMQLLSSAMFLKQTDDTRQFTKGIIQTSAGANTTRGAAWTIRALGHSAAMTPDDDEPLRSELIASVHHNVDAYYLRYVAQPSNPLGMVQPYNDYAPGNGMLDSASWMEDFLTWAFGNLASLRICSPTYAAKLDQFIDWKYRSIVGRLGPNMAGHWSFKQAAQYTVPYAPSESVNWSDGSGPWYASWGAAYVAAGNSYQEGNLLLGSYIDGDGLSTSYWGNLQPAIAYAVEHGATGALEAYDRMVGADNWQQAAQYFNSDTPVWSVRPRNVAY